LVTKNLLQKEITNEQNLPEERIMQSYMSSTEDGPVAFWR